MTNASESLRAALADRYVLERELGRGGMATVYLAHDLRHDRPVAIKVLRPELAAVIGAERFLGEIRVTANLQHPNLLPLFDSGESGSFLFYVMPYVEGETLRARLVRERQLPVEETVRVITLLANALDSAHAQGVIHRDLKPENILLKAGQPVIADFGIALAVAHAGGARVTETGLSLGTPHYMSPEQAAGEREIDARSDQYALAAVAYEMLSGEPPHTGPTAQAIVARLMTEKPRSLRATRPGVPAAMDLAIIRALAKLPADRFPTCGAFANELTEACAPAFPHRGRRWLIAASLVAVALAATLGWLAFGYHRQTHATAAESSKSIAVIPLVNVGRDSSQEYFADGMTDELTSALSRVPGLRVASRTSAFVFKGRRDLDVREIGRKLNVDAVLEGSVRRAGQRLKLSAQLTSVGDGLALWSDSYERQLADVFQVQDDIARAIVEALQGRLGLASVSRTTQPTQDLEAYDLYLRAGFFYRKHTEPAFRKSLSLYQAALAKDPGFAAAWVGVSIVLVWLADDWLPPREAYPKAKAAATRALALDPTLPLAHGEMGVILMNYDWDFEGAESHIRQALELSPAAGPYYDLSNLFGMTSRLDSAITAARKAQQLDPLDPQTTTNIGDLLVMARRLEEGMAEYRKALELEPTYGLALLGLANALIAQGQAEEAVRVLQRTPETGVRAQVALGRAYATLGRRTDAERIAHALEAEARRRYVRAEGIAAIYAALGDRDTAFQLLERAFADRSAGLAWLRTSAWFAPLRGDPRFVALAQRVGLGATAP